MPSVQRSQHLDPVTPLAQTQAPKAFVQVESETPALVSDDLRLSQQAKAEPEMSFVEDESRPWQIKSAHLNFGYVLDNNVLHTGPMHFQHAERGSDFYISGYQQTDRKNWEYLSIRPGQRFAPDEPQFNLGANVTFNNGFGLEVDAKHNKIIMDGYEQEVGFEGTLNGQEITGTRPLNQVLQQHEQTLGNMQISALGTYTVDLPAPAQHRFSWMSKAGPSLLTTNTRTRILDAEGTFSGGTSGFQAVGYGAMVENALRYQFGPKLGQLGLELSHSLAYLNYANYQTVDGYTGSHKALYSGLALKATVGLFGNRDKNQKP